MMTHTSHVQKTSKTSPFSRLDISFPLMCMYKCVCIYIYIYVDIHIGQTCQSSPFLKLSASFLFMHMYMYKSIKRTELGCRSSLCRASTACPRLTVIFINIRDSTPGNEDSPPSPWKQLTQKFNRVRVTHRHIMHRVIENMVTV